MAIDDPILDEVVQVRMSFDVSRQAGRSGQIARDWFDLAWHEPGGSIRDRLAAGQVSNGLYVLATTRAGGWPNRYARDNILGIRMPHAAVVL